MNTKWKRALLERIRQSSAAVRDDLVVMIACRLAAAEVLLAKATGLSPIVVRDLVADAGKEIFDSMGDPPAAEALPPPARKGGAA